MKYVSIIIWDKFVGFEDLEKNSIYEYVKGLCAIFDKKYVHQYPLVYQKILLSS